jgi:hypothetical protein
MLSAPEYPENQTDISDFDTLPEELKVLILFEMGLGKMEFLNMRLVSKTWNIYAQRFGNDLIQKYFPYLFNTQADNCEKASLPTFYVQLNFFIKATFSNINEKLLLAALRGDKNPIVALTDNNEKAQLLGILLSNGYQVVSIPEICKQVAFDTAFILCANNGNIELLKAFQELPISKEKEETAVSYAVKRGDFRMVKAITGSRAFYFSSYCVVQAMSQNNIQMALYLQRGNAPAKPNELETILKDILLYDNENAFKNTAKHPEISAAILEKELLAVDVVPRVRKWILQALKDKYQKTNYWIPTLFGYGRSIWNLQKIFSDHFKSWTTSLLMWFVKQDDNSIISFYLSLADKNAWDWKLACTAKIGALNYAVTNGKIGPLEVLLEDEHIPLSISAKKDAIGLANHQAIIDILTDSIDKQTKREATTSKPTIWDSIPAVTFSFSSLRSTVSATMTTTTTIPIRLMCNKPQ